MTPRVGVRCTPYGHLDVGAISPEEQAEILASLRLGINPADINPEYNSGDFSSPVQALTS